MQLLNPFDGNVVEISKDMPVTGVQRLEARTPDGRYVSHANKATVVHYRMRQHPRSQLVRITRRGGRKGARGSDIGKALGAGGIPRTARALIRVGQTAQRVGQSHAADATRRFSRGVLDDRDRLISETRRGLNAAEYKGGKAGAVGAMASRLAPMSGLGGSAAYLAGRHRGRQQVGKRYARDVFGKSSADHTVHADRRGTSPLLPDGARRGRKLTGDDVSKGLGSALLRLAGGTDKAVSRGMQLVADAPKPTKVPRSAPTGNLRRRLAGVPGPAGGSELARRLQQS